LTVKLRRERRQLLWDIKQRTGCVDCGYNKHPVALDFDHVKSGKKYVVSDLICNSLETMLAEIALCEVVCANCHRCRTARRRKPIGIDDPPRRRRSRTGWTEQLTPEAYAIKIRCSRKANAKNRQRIQAIKSASGCLDCGYNQNPEALEFDHVRGEKRDTLAAMAGYKKETLLEEISKCEIVCCNCHRIRTHERRQAKQRMTCKKSSE